MHNEALGDYLPDRSQRGHGTEYDGLEAQSRPSSKQQRRIATASISTQFVVATRCRIGDNDGHAN